MENDPAITIIEPIGSFELYLKYSNRLFERFITDFGMLSKKIKNKKVHEFRLNIKKLNAMYSFIRFINNETELEYPFVAKIYKQTGNFRNVRNQERIFKDFCSLYKVKIKYLKRELKNTAKNKKEKIKLSKNENQPSFILEIKEKLEKLNPEVFKENAIRYSVSLAEQLKSDLLKEDYENNYLHDLRKTLKEFYFNQTSFNRAFEFNYFSSSFLEQIHLLQDTIGKWYDVILLGKALETYKLEFSGNASQKKFFQMELISNEVNKKISVYELEIGFYKKKIYKRLKENKIKN